MAAEHPHAEIAESLWSAVAEGDAETLEQIFAPDIVWRSMGQNKIVAGEYRGPESVMEYLATIGEASDEFVSTLDDIYIGKDGAVLEFHADARRATRTMTMHYLLRIQIRDGLIHDAVNTPVDQHANDTFWG